MALEAVCYNYCKDYNSLSSPWSYDYGNNSIQYWDEQQHHQFINSSYSSRDGNNYCRVELPYNDVSGSGKAPPAATAGGGDGGGRKRKRRRRSSKNEEQAEQQRMTHIAVERNRRKQMNDYLAVIRSLMPPSYSQRGDQASIVGGAINYVKELEQLLQSLEAHKRSKQDTDSISSSHGNSTNTTSRDDDNDDEPRPFGDFFNYPQYSTSNQAIRSSNCSNNEIEVIVVDGHANVKILAKKQNKQLLKLLAAFQGLSLSVLLLSLTTLHPFVLYSFNLKVDGGSQLNSVDDIAAATNQILAQIQEEAASLPQ
ncbi:hypothetical protein Cgig2_025968 [Carnegiea gigantea]|uniref:BHLH domain-containing protein n=1 Tax=Carnegiea gigantea TaxID=171969 RepID=A0A9Q1JZ58_9CARY|nr:hypothetical protein Cgig2_025968 [Carnegiea gigantea]